MAQKADQSNGDKQRTDIDRLLRALNHPIRRRILVALAQERGSAKTLAKAFREHLGVISYHLNKVLDQECGVVELVERVKRRGASEKIYVLRRESILGILGSPDLSDPVRLGLLGASLKEFFSETIAAIEAGAVDSSEPSTLEWHPVQLDGQSWQEIREAAEQFRKKVRKAVGESKSRRNSGSTEALRNAIIGVALYEAASGLRRLNRGA